MTSASGSFRRGRSRLGRSAAQSRRVGSPRAGAVLRRRGHRPARPGLLHPGVGARPGPGGDPAMALPPRRPRRAARRSRPGESRPGPRLPRVRRSRRAAAAGWPRTVRLAGPRLHGRRSPTRRSPGPSRDGTPWRPPPYHWGGILVERKLFDNVGGYCTRYSGWGCEDDDLIAKLKGRIPVLRAWRGARGLACLHFEHSRARAVTLPANQAILAQRLADGIDAMIAEDKSNGRTRRDHGHRPA